MSIAFNTQIMDKRLRDALCADAHCHSGLAPEELDPIRRSGPRCSVFEAAALASNVPRLLSARPDANVAAHAAQSLRVRLDSTTKSHAR